MGDQSKIRVVYDGDCPFCSRYVRLTRLRAEFGSVELVNARDNVHIYENYLDRGFDLNDGMILEIDGATYHGADCLNRLALMSSQSSIFNAITAGLFRHPKLSAFSYPILRAGRNAVLKLKGIPQL